MLFDTFTSGQVHLSDFWMLIRSPGDPRDQNIYGRWLSFRYNPLFTFILFRSVVTCHFSSWTGSRFWIGFPEISGARTWKYQSEQINFRALKSFDFQSHFRKEDIECRGNKWNKIPIVENFTGHPSWQQQIYEKFWRKKFKKVEHATSYHLQDHIHRPSFLIVSWFKTFLGLFNGFSNSYVSQGQNDGPSS